MSFFRKPGRGFRSAFKWVACLVLLCPFALSIPAQALESGDILAVDGCESWVSLRVQSDHSAQRMTKIPKDALVRFLSDGGAGFYRVQYGDASELNKFGRDTYLYVMYMSEDGWLYVSNHPFCVHMKGALNAGPRREGWINAADVGIMGKIQ